ncbi:hypothetical protein [Orientia tsutsugamushi]|nr:hypothetical protein [Orientia tsutsugamushi]
MNVFEITFTTVSFCCNASIYCIIFLPSIYLADRYIIIYNEV